jgi:tRNA threonylcarbamoyladenosine biosynthesis protein TsaE
VQQLFSLQCDLDGAADIAGKIYTQTRTYPILLLHGELGTGKTTLSKLLLKTCGVTSEVNSPTFNIVNEYRNERGEVFYHFDLYRIKYADELYEIGFTEYLDSGNLCLIEWPEIAMDLMRGPYLDLQISHDDGKRLYELSLVK